MNSILEVNKPKVTQSIIIYGGRFQPFHKGHYAAYQNLVSEFGKANVYIGTSNDTSSNKSPFTFKEKKEIATKMFGVPVTKFIKVNNPYRPMEILSKYDGKITQYIAAVGEKDASRLKSGYFKPYKGKAGYGYDEVGYYYTVPAEANPISGTDVRKKLGSSNKEVAKKFFLKAYPSFDKDIFKMISSKLNEDGMPGGIGVGLTLPDGYINGAPTGSKNEIIGEIEKDVNEFITQYFNEDISESKENSINHFVEYASKKLKLNERPKITLLTGREYSEAKISLGGYNPMSKEIYVAIEGRLTADILRTIAHEMVHRKQDELGLVKDEIKDGATGSPIENQAHAVAGILMRNYGKINKQIYNEAIDKKNVHNINLKLNSVSLKRFQTTPTFQKLLHSDQLKNLKIGDNKLVVNNTIWSVLQRLEGPGNYQIEKLKEDINIDVDRGDTVLMGKFKNKKVVVKNIGKDDHGMPTINGKKAATFRLGDKGQNIFKKDENIDEMNSMDIHFINIIKKYRDSTFRKRINAYIFGNPNKNNPNAVVKALRNMGYDEITQMEKELNIKPDLNESLLLEGGAYGHMSHPFDDMDLTFGDLKNIISKALNGDLGVVREKTDGQALAISWKNGRLIAARNKGNLANAGANAMGIEDVASKFGGRGGLTDAYNFAMKDLSAAIQSLSEAQRKKIFNEGKCFMNLEVIWPTSVNVIPYNQALLVFHNAVEYNEAGNPIGKIDGAESILGGMLKQINAHVQSKYTIQGPPIVKLPKTKELSSQKGKFKAMITKLQSEFGLTDKDGVADYHQAWWENFVDNSKKKISALEKAGLVKRWAFDNKSMRVGDIKDEKARTWAEGIDKGPKTTIMSGNLRKFEDIFLGVGAEVLSFMGSVLTAQPDKALQAMRAELESTASQIMNGGTITQIKKLEKELSRLNSIGGFEKIVPSEGIVFSYKGNAYKLTGAFAPLNQILGIFKFSR